MNLEKIPPHLAAVAEALQLLDQEAISKAVTFLHEIREQHGMVWIIGNGGSAATASHFANDLRKMCALPAVALPDLTATFTAYANDDGWSNSFVYPLHLFMKPLDCLVAISTSGRSMNVLDAAAQASSTHRLISLTGLPGPRNTLAGYQARSVVYAKSPDIKVQEDIHMIVCHAIAAALTDQP